MTTYIVCEVEHHFEWQSRSDFIVTRHPKAFTCINLKVIKFYQHLICTNIIFFIFAVDFIFVWFNSDWRQSWRANKNSLGNFISLYTLIECYFAITSVQSYQYRFPFYLKKIKKKSDCKKMFTFQYIYGSFLFKSIKVIELPWWC